MNINPINNSQPSFGMAYKVTEEGKELLTNAIRKQGGEALINVRALQDMFGRSEDTFFITSPFEWSKPKNIFSKGVAKLFSHNKLDLQYDRSVSIGRAEPSKTRYIVNAREFVKNPGKFLQKLDGNYLKRSHAISKQAVLDELISDSLISVPLP